MSVDPEGFAIFQHKVERTSVTEVRHIYKFAVTVASPLQCEHSHLIAVNPFFAVAIAVTKWVYIAVDTPLQCEHPHLIPIDPFKKEGK